MNELNLSELQCGLRWHPDWWLMLLRRSHMRISYGFLFPSPLAMPRDLVQVMTHRNELNLSRASMRSAPQWHSMIERWQPEVWVTVALLGSSMSSDTSSENFNKRPDAWHQLAGPGRLHFWHSLKLSSVTARVVAEMLWLVKLLSSWKVRPASLSSTSASARMHSPL